MVIYDTHKIFKISLLQNNSCDLKGRLLAKTLLADIFKFFYTKVDFSFKMLIM